MVSKKAKESGVDHGEFPSFGDLGVLPIAKLFVDFILYVLPKGLSFRIISKKNSQVRKRKMLGGNVPLSTNIIGTRIKHIDSANHGL